MNNQNSINEKINRLLSEINCYINFLYICPCVYTRNMILNQLSEKVRLVNSFVNIKNEENALPKQPQLPPQPQQRTFTLGELSKYTGQGGQPAYVAVNGVVYDVTNNATWAAGTHFGLNAGKDLTQEFASCHQAQQILSNLKVVGRLV